MTKPYSSGCPHCLSERCWCFERFTRSTSKHVRASGRVYLTSDTDSSQAKVSFVYWLLPRRHIFWQWCATPEEGTELLWFFVYRPSLRRLERRGEKTSRGISHLIDSARTASLAFRVRIYTSFRWIEIRAQWRNLERGFKPLTSIYFTCTRLIHPRFLWI